jgi:hypothetical protein
MHLSFVVVGAALAPELNLRNLIATLLAFFFAVGLAAHALDELAGHPLGTDIPAVILAAVAIAGLGTAAAIGIAGAMLSDARLLWFIIVGIFLAVSYNLELFGGLFHSDVWFGLAWGAFPALTAHFAQTGTISAVALLGAGYTFAMSLTQRQLSTPARRLRRKVHSVEGTIHLQDGTIVRVDRQLMLRPLERALQLLVMTSLLIATALLAMRLLRGEWIAGF